MIKKIVTYPSKILRQVSEEVDLSKLSEYQELIQDMFDTMYANNGVGLAAIQIGKPVRIVVSDTGHGEEVYINPELISLGGKLEKVNEGCLSFPSSNDSSKNGLMVDRHTEAIIRFYDRNGKQMVVDTTKSGTNQILEELRAQEIQHELEHLDGILMTDKVSPLKRELFLKKYSKQK